MLEARDGALDRALSRSSLPAFSDRVLLRTPLTQIELEAGAAYG